MNSWTYAVLLVSVAGCAAPTVEAHEAAAELREDTRRIGTVSRQELASDVTDPASTVGTFAKPAPAPGDMRVAVIGIVSSKLCFRVDEAGDRSDFVWRMNNASWSALALPAAALSKPVPWPTSLPAMVKVLDSSGDGVHSAAVCLPAPTFTDDTRLIALTVAWDSRTRKLALWQLTE